MDFKKKFNNVQLRFCKLQGSEHFHPEFFRKGVILRDREIYHQTKVRTSLGTLMLEGYHAKSFKITTKIFCKIIFFYYTHTIDSIKSSLMRTPVSSVSQNSTPGY